jgi:hypothetical protein
MTRKALGSAGRMGGHVWNLDGVRLVPYRLPELISAVDALRYGGRERE